MNQDELQTLLSVHGLPTRIKGDEVAVQTCVFCGNPKYNLELNASRGVYHAWCCGARGRVQNFLREHLRVEKDVPVNIQYTAKSRGVPIIPTAFTKTVDAEWAWSYLFNRGLGVVDVAIYNIGQGFGDKWEGRVVFTLFDYWSHEAVGFLGRAALPGVNPKYYAEWGAETKRITGYGARSDTHVLVEGVFDGISVHRAGFNAAVLGGVQEVAVEEWSARVPPDHHVVVMLDGDATAQAEQLYWRVLPVHDKTSIVRLPTLLDPAILEPLVIQQLIRRSREHRP